MPELNLVAFFWRIVFIGGQKISLLGGDVSVQDRQPPTRAPYTGDEIPLVGHVVSLLENAVIVQGHRRYFHRRL